jgi:hypothetical protein
MKGPSLGCLLLAVYLVGCAPHRPDDGSGNPKTDASCAMCTADKRGVVNCDGTITTCAASEECDPTANACVDACIAAETSHSSVGCEYYSTSMDSFGNGVPGSSLCFAAFVANTWTTPAHINVEYKGQTMPVATFTRLPVGSGPSLTYQPYDANAGLAPGQVAILFLGGTQGTPPSGCPAPPAAATPQIVGTGISDSFHITTDVPTVAYQINPYGGGSVAVTGASLLIPTSAWDVNYLAVNVSQQEADLALNPSMNIIARDDATVVTLVPNVPLAGGPGLTAGPAGQPVQISLHKGQNIQITQGPELTGSVITASAPVGVMAGQFCMRVPAGTTYCDHGEQMIPPVRALGSRYAGVMYRPRVPAETQTFWRVIGAVDGTQLTWSQSVGGPAALAKGQAVTFETGTPFTVASQDADHPFMLFTYMTSSGFVGDGYGDPDFVLDVPPDQFLGQYVFFTDPTYPETNLVLVRSRAQDGQFHDVTLDCLGVIPSWTPIDNDTQWARTDLQTGDFGPVGSCSNGRHEIHSDAPFGLQVWGWGTPNTSTFTANVSYGYPGGMNVKPINDVIIE